MKPLPATAIGEPLEGFAFTTHFGATAIAGAVAAPAAGTDAATATSKATAALPTRAAGGRALRINRLSITRPIVCARAAG